ncbi:hypothetical protein MPH_11195 [Macrophomina phaseolina MS6]|uniref:Uncharacterized protein n=1 Tax=Macrophomina phaseolina (strain MS6) TaxID=1126212 RepID=K2RFP3_MACPH|nr:hypothetical protein MPH_11195 [Macrophomina phaseolina MS6]
MFATLLSPHFELEPVTQDDMILASLTWGFTLGFGLLTTWTAIKQSYQAYSKHGWRKLNNPYIWMIWLEIAVCLSFSIICWMYLRGVIPPSFAFYFCILTTWALQVQFLLQIIINRVSVLLVDRKKAYRIKVGVAILITAVNISVYCIWIPARLQVSKAYIHLNDIWDRIEKVIYLIVDACLNRYFIKVVQDRLVRQGFKKYESVVKFNLYIIGFSLSMDVLIISMMSLSNSFVYMQFHPLAYIVKLNIEMSMADLIARVTRSQSIDRRINNRNRHLHYSTTAYSISDRVDKPQPVALKSTGSTRISSTGVSSRYVRARPTSPDGDALELQDIGSLEQQNSHGDISEDIEDEDEDGRAPSPPPNRIMVNRTQEFQVRIEGVSLSDNSLATRAVVAGFEGYDRRRREEDERPLRKEEPSIPEAPSNDQQKYGVSTRVWGPLGS